MTVETVLHVIASSWTALILLAFVGYIAYSIQARRLRPGQPALFSAKQLAGFSSRHSDRSGRWTIAALTTAALVVWALVLTNIDGLALVIFVGLTVGLVYMLLEEPRSRV